MFLVLFLFKILVLHYGGDYILACTGTYVEDIWHMSKKEDLVVCWLFVGWA